MKCICIFMMQVSLIGYLWRYMWSQKSLPNSNKILFQDAENSLNHDLFHHSVLHTSHHHRVTRNITTSHVTSIHYLELFSGFYACVYKAILKYSYKNSRKKMHTLYDACPSVCLFNPFPMKRFSVARIIFSP